MENHQEMGLDSGLANVLATCGHWSS